MTTQIWAHRGASRAAPENTLKAFELAVQLGADGIELDVMRTKDLEIVVTHDETCQRLTGSEGVIKEKTLTELHQLDFGWYFPDQEKHRIPVLAEVFDLIRPSRLLINIELKNNVYYDPGLEQAVIRLAVEHKMTDRIIFSSFNHYSMRQAAMLAADQAEGIRSGILYSCELVEPWQYARSIGVQAIHPLYASLQMPGLVDSCRAAGIAVHAWTINNPEHIRMALQSGADAIITDLPDQALAIREAFTHK